MGKESPPTKKKKRKKRKKEKTVPQTHPSRSWQVVVRDLAFILIAQAGLKLSSP